MGLPDTGKTTLAAELKKQLQYKGKTVAWFNADDIRHINNDWDFSPEGRIRQANRMRILADGMMTDYVICDFVAPLKEMRDIFGADYTIWMNTEESSCYEDTNAIFEKPEYGEWHCVATAKDAPNTVPYFIDILLQSPRPS